MQFIGSKLRGLREGKNLRIEDLSEITGISVSTLSDIETGETKNPRKATVKLICDALKVPETYFYLEDSRLPTDLIPEMPEETRNFIMNGRNVPFLVLTEKAAKNGLTPEQFDKLLELWLEIKK
ncbi:MAG: hypothetical protein K0Q77_99 [Anaerosporomusa subterranea]|nr:hypothetical protein [Anaerosporomusa subterranea]